MLSLACVGGGTGGGGGGGRGGGGGQWGQLPPQNQSPTVTSVTQQAPFIRYHILTN